MSQCECLPPLSVLINYRPGMGESGRYKLAHLFWTTLYVYPERLSKKYYNHRQYWARDPRRPPVGYMGVFDAFCLQVKVMGAEELPRGSQATHIQTIRQAHAQRLK